jgi:hypothetical protein
MARAKAKGIKIGRPKIGFEVRQQIAKLAKKGQTPYAIANCKGTWGGVLQGCDSQRVVHMKILLAGLPATGKTCVGQYLTKQPRNLEAIHLRVPL